MGRLERLAKGLGVSFGVIKYSKMDCGDAYITTNI